MSGIDSIYLVLYLIVEVANYLLGYLVLFNFHIKKNIGNWVVAAMILLGIHFTVGFLSGAHTAHGISLFTMIVVPLFLVEENKKMGLGIYSLIWICVMSIPLTITFLLTYLLSADMKDMFTNQGMELALECVMICLLLAFSLYKKLTHSSTETIKIGRPQYILFNIGALCVFILIGMIQVLCALLPTMRIASFIGFATAITCLVFLFLLLWHGNAVNKEIELKDRIRTMEMYSKLEEEHFKLLLSQDEKMRKFRHDFKAHAVALRGYSQNGQFEELTEYIDKMMEETAYEKVRSYTHDMGVDAVLAELEEKAREKGITLNVKGTLAQNSPVSSFEWCSVFYNVIQNAIEACEKIEREVPKVVEVTIANFNSKNVITVVNPVEQDIKIGNELPRTTKTDKLSHGIGTMNVQEIVHKYNGAMKFSCENLIFRVEMVI